MLHYIQDTKYVAETISFIVPFSDMLQGADTITGIPIVTVSVFSGLDPNPSLLLYQGAQVHTGNTVEQRIWNGVAGVLYIINIKVNTTQGKTYEKECYLGIIEQVGTSSSQVITFYYTSRPYPIEYAEGAMSDIALSYFHLLLNPRWTESVKTNIATRDSLLYIGAIYYNNYPPEQLKSNITPMQGYLIANTAINYNNPHEDLKNNIAAISGTLQVVQVFYTTYVPEQLKSNIAPQSGTLA